MSAMTGFMIAVAGTAVLIYALMSAKRSRTHRRNNTTADGASAFAGDSSDVAWGVAWLGGGTSSGSDHSRSCSSEGFSSDIGGSSSDCGGGGGDGGGSGD